ncbi:hypothetical protein H4219_004021 [Mycoemilia scoparia]|uniref:Transcription initiation factor IIE subunit alpha n=1 Tax=Mycoemilia scoparia TaxID=417184 RepID=A0A9W8A130_9FUNG|nr:hypothetical protein H4219_004021 [Mycoemilia scoparia]
MNGILHISEKRSDLRKQDQTKVPRTYYHLDFKLFVDVVKWKVWKLQKIVQERVNEKPTHKEYLCSNDSCDASYSTMEALPLIDYMGIFRCEVCSSELIDNKKALESLASESLMATMSKQCRKIIDLLKETDKIILPLPIPLEKVPPPDYEGDDFAGFNLKSGKQANGKDISIAGDSGVRTGQIVVEFGPDLSSKEAAKLREQEVDQKRKQNALPPWHIWSTVSYTQMVPDEKIVPAARIEHEKRISHLRKSHTHSGMDERSKTQNGSTASSTALGSRSHSAPQPFFDKQDDESDDEQREQYFSDYYNIYARKVGIELKPDAKGRFFSILAQFKACEKLEREALEIEREYQSKHHPEKSSVVKLDSNFIPKSSDAAERLRRARNRRKRLFDFLEPGASNESTSQPAKRTQLENGHSGGERKSTNKQANTSQTLKV